MSKIIATKDGRQKTFTEIGWKLLGKNTNGWKVIPKEAQGKKSGEGEKRKSGESE